MTKWIKSRGINGEYGYRNLDTGEFRTTLPQEELEKINDAVLRDYSSKQAEYKRQVEKRKNHSDETIKKTINRPQLVAKKNGNFAVKQQRELAPSENSIQATYPEFDLITLFTGTKPAREFGNNIMKIAKLQKSYTGVPARIDYNTGKVMSEEFPNYAGDIWTTTNFDAAKMYSEGGIGLGKVYSIFGNTRKLAKMPTISKEIDQVNWTDMPFIFKDGKFQLHPEARVYHSMDHGQTFINSKGIHENRAILGVFLS